MTRPDYLMPLLNMDRAELIRSGAQRLVKPGFWTLERRAGAEPLVRLHRGAEAQ